MPERLFNAVSVGMCWLAGGCIVGMMLLTSSDVVLRYLGYPIKGVFDVVGLLGALVVALPIARTQILNRHVAMEFMAHRKSSVLRATSRALTLALSVAIYALITWQLTAFAAKLKTVGRVSDTVEIPLYPFVYAIAFAFLVNCFVLAAQFYGALRPGKE
jgi:TRAP-type C4-dicarboxylate transport system permease small subunit